MKLQIAQTLHELDALMGLWQALETQPECTIFQTFAWNRLAADVFQSSERAFVIAVESDFGACILPVARRRESLGLLGEELFDYRDPLVMGEAEPLLRIALQNLAALELPLAIRGLRGESCLADWQFADPQPFCRAPAVRRKNTTAEGFEQQHAHLCRQRSRLLRMGATVSKRGGSDSALLRWIYEGIAGQNRDCLFSDPKRIDFMVAAAALPESRCEIFTLELEGSVIAAFVTFLENDIRRFYTNFYDQGWSRYSPGMTLLFEATLQTLREGRDCDYMTGEQPYKLRLATGSVPLYRVDCSYQRLAALTVTMQSLAA